MKLAIEGGKPIRHKRISSWPHFEDDEISAVARILRSGKVNQWTGNECEKFSSDFAKYLGITYCVPLVNGTAALEVACRILGIGKGDEVIVSPRSFIASATCVATVGALPIFVDIERDSGNVDPQKVRSAITKKTRAIIAVHLAGWPCKLDLLQEICQRHNLYLIEDCAQALGSKYKNRFVGTWGDAATFSFCQDKIVTTGGEGGMLVVKNKKYYEKAWSYKDHGKNREKALKKHNTYSFKWLHDSLGTNLRMTEIQAAIGRAQLKKLDIWIAKRRKIARIFNTTFSTYPSLRVTIPPRYVFHSYYKYYVYLRLEKLKRGWSKEKVLEAINREGIPAFYGSCSEIYREHVWRIIPEVKRSIPKKPLPVARELGETAVLFLVHPTLSDRDIDDTVKGITRVLDAVTL